MIKTIIRKITWLDKNYVNFGYGCGYVIIDKNHSYFAFNYQDLDIEIHGGLTFGRLITQSFVDSFNKDAIFSDGFLERTDIGSYMFGFDTAHFGDNQICQNREFVLAETEKLRQQFIKN